MLKLVLMMLSFISVGASAAANAASLGYRAGDVTSRRVATALALTCSPETWRTLVHSARLGSFENKQAIRVELHGSVATLDHPQMRIEKLADGSWQATRGSETVRGRDACELLAHAPRPSQPVARSLFISRAWAADLVKEDRSDDYWALGIGTGLLVLDLAFPPATLLSAAFLVFDGWSLVQNSLSLATKTSYEDILNHDFELQCSRGATVLKSAAGRIVIRKLFTKLGRLATIDIYGKNSDTPFEGTADLAPRSAEFLRNLAADCDTGEDAARLATHLKVERLNALAKVDQSTSIAVPHLLVTPKSDAVVN